MKNGTEAQETEKKIYKSLEIARKLQNIPRKQVARELNVTGARVTQIFNDHSMSVKQMCEMAEAVGVEIKLCAKESLPF